MADIELMPGIDTAFLVAFLGIILVVGAIFYIYYALALMSIAKRTDTPNAWLAWIPIANIYLMTQIAKVPWWTMFALVLILVPYIGPIIYSAVTVWWFWKIAERRGKEGWWGILMIIPLVNLVVLGILAWGKD